MIPLAHIAGIPVEETLLSFGPVGAVAAGAVVASARARARRLRRAGTRPMAPSRTRQAALPEAARVPRPRG